MFAVGPNVRAFGSATKYREVWEWSQTSLCFVADSNRGPLACEASTLNQLS